MLWKHLRESSKRKFTFRDSECQSELTREKEDAERKDDDAESRESDRLNMHLRADGSYDSGLQEIGKKILSTTPTAAAVTLVILAAKSKIAEVLFHLIC